MNGVKKVAIQADGRSRRCVECPYRPCSPTMFKICGDSFVEGFIKGAAWRDKIKKEFEEL